MSNNNDRFKFRAWDTKRKTMIYTGNRLLICGDCIPMQCTGLKDRNGKLIYEYDILLLQISNMKYTAHVIWLESYYAMIFSGSEMVMLSERELHKLEVLGNIYENPELLEGSK